MSKAEEDLYNFVKHLNNAERQTIVEYYTRIIEKERR